MISKKANHAVAKQAPIGGLGLVEPPPIFIECEAFHGTLTTLFLCVKESRLNLLEVPLAPICHAYLAYLSTSPDASLNEAASALAALAYLLERKAWSLLPTEEEAPEEAELAQPFALEGCLDLFEETIQALMVFKTDREKIFFRANLDAQMAFQPELELDELTISDLATILSSILAKAEPDLSPPVLSSRRNLAEVMREILLQIGHSWVLFLDILPNRFTKTDVVYGFLAMLELIKLGQLQIEIRDGGLFLARA